MPSLFPSDDLEDPRQAAYQEQAPVQPPVEAPAQPLVKAPVQPPVEGQMGFSIVTGMQVYDGMEPYMSLKVIC